MKCWAYVGGSNGPVRGERGMGLRNDRSLRARISE